MGGALLESIESTLPNGQRHTFVLERCERAGDCATCSVVKDGGDDPDCTHGAEIVAEVALRPAGGIELRGGEGVARVTKPGLGLEVGGPAINPVPRRNISEMVGEELAYAPGLAGAVVTISVPGGEEMAAQTINARLGLLGGISILGTTGIVKPYSTAAYKASVVQAIDVARERGCETLVLTTGGKSEAYAMRLFPELPEEAFVQVGDFVGVGVRHACRRSARRAVVVGMIGKLSKMADGKTMTHAAGSEVSMDLLAEISASLGARDEVVAEIRAANTARHVLGARTAGGHSRARGGPCGPGGPEARGVRRRSARSPRGAGRFRRQDPRPLPGGTMSGSNDSMPADIGGTNDMRQMTARGRGIEDDSFAIIDAEVGEHDFPQGEWQVVRRVIHATADFEFRSLMRFSADAIASGTRALRAGCPVVVDVKMIAVGLNEERLASYGCRVHSFISDPDVIAEARTKNSTRAIEAMGKAHRLGLLDGAVVAIGNAPTALLETLRLVREAGARPALIVGVPVGFVSAAESKEALLASGVPFVAARGRKGGSTIAVAILHALLYLAVHGAASGARQEAP